MHPNFLRDDYSLSNLLATTIPPDMDIYEMGDAMATALGDKNPVGGGGDGTVVVARHINILLCF